MSLKVNFELLGTSRNIWNFGSNEEKRSTFNKFSNVGKFAMRDLFGFIRRSRSAILYKMLKFVFHMQQQCWVKITKWANHETW